MAAIIPSETWNGVVPFIGAIMFLLILAWWIIESVIAGIQQVRNSWHAWHEESRFM
ncbi:MAG: hypothetical protein M3008_07010 [Chloroflexota bacterium]|nr:hypothetical protein [Chloroflexota bacterium]